MATHMKIYFFPSLGCYYEAACAPQKCWKTDVYYRVSIARVPTSNMSGLCWVCKCSHAVTFAWIGECSRMSFCFAGGFGLIQECVGGPMHSDITSLCITPRRCGDDQDRAVWSWPFTLSMKSEGQKKKMHLALTGGDKLLPHRMKMT